MTIEIPDDRQQAFINACEQAFRSLRVRADEVEMERRDHKFADELRDHAEALYDLARLMER